MTEVRLAVSDEPWKTRFIGNGYGWRCILRFIGIKGFPEVLK
jgi:hypothetical protein